MTWLTRYVRSEAVLDYRSYAYFAQQELGVPIPYSDREWSALRGALKKFFETYPGTDFDTLCDLVGWAKAKKRHPNHCYGLFGLYRYAVADGAVQPPGTDTRTEERIVEALTMETDPRWRSMLIGSEGSQTRREVLAAWRDTRQPVLLARTARSLFT